MFLTTAAVLAIVSAVGIVVSVVALANDETLLRWWATMIVSFTVGVGVTVFFGNEYFLEEPLLSWRATDFDTVPRCSRVERDIVCCRTGANVTCMIDKETSATSVDAGQDQETP